MYENCRIQGPYERPDGRLIVIVTKENGTKSTISYPKYLMECQLNRYLDKDETVDHIDKNPLNNDLSNLRILNRSEHVAIDIKRNRDAIVTCQYCGKEFTIPGSKLHDRNRNDGTRESSGYFCSRTCSGKYGASVRYGGQKYKDIKRVTPIKFTIKGI